MYFQLHAPTKLGLLLILTGQGSVLSPPPVTAEEEVQNDTFDLHPFNSVFSSNKNSYGP